MKFTARQIGMILASEPDDVTGEEGCGVELRGSGDYAVARALEEKGLGYVEGPGGWLPGMYWSNGDGLSVRADLLPQPPLNQAPDCC